MSAIDGILNSCEIDAFPVFSSRDGNPAEAAKLVAMMQEMIFALMRTGDPTTHAIAKAAGGAFPNWVPARRHGVAVHRVT